MEERVSVEYVQDLIVNSKLTHKEISEKLKIKYPGVRGLSEMSVRRFCSNHNIHRTSRLTDGELDSVIRKAVSEVGPTYGRKMIKGKLEAQNIKVHDKRVSTSLSRVAPQYAQQRKQNTARLLNPLPYKADYFGHKIHLDQNEKLVMYGCTTVLASDGYSNYVLAAASMPIKNNLEIYKSVFRPVLLNYGLWDQVRVDCGKEFYLILFIQESLSSKRHNILRKPYMQTPSTKNHMAERHWVEINSRINYPIKALLNNLAQRDLIDMTNETDRFCVSWITIQTVQTGIRELMPAWNYHSIPGKGKPFELMNNNYKASMLQEREIPPVEHAVLQYEQSGGKLTNFGNFGIDPLETNVQLQQTRMVQFSSHYPSFDVIFNAAVNNNGNFFMQAVLLFISLTKELQLRD